MEGDVKLETSGVRIEGSYLYVNGPSFELNDETRHVEDHSGNWRRALVHESDDTLIVNFADDYRGIVINGNRSEGIKLNGEILCSDLLESRRLLATHHFGVSESANFYVGGDAKFKEAPVVPDILLEKPASSRLLPERESLIEIIEELRQTNSRLEARIVALEA